jgi:tetratricopeptide (TPR) repeat protein
LRIGSGGKRDPACGKPHGRKDADMALDVKKFADMKEKSDIDGLVKSLASEKNPAGRLCAARALAGLDWKAGDVHKPKDVIANLQKGLKDKKINVQLIAADGLARMGWDPAGQEVDPAYWVVKLDGDRCKQSGPAAVYLLLRVFSHPDPDIRARAMDILVEIGEPASRALIKSILDATPETLGPWTGSVEEPTGVDIIRQLDTWAQALSKFGPSAVAEFYQQSKKEIEGRLDVVDSQLGGTKPGSLGFNYATNGMYLAFATLLKLKDREALDSLGRILSGLEEKFHEMAILVLTQIQPPQIESLSTLAGGKSPKAAKIAAEALARLSRKSPEPEEDSGLKTAQDYFLKGARLGTQLKWEEAITLLEQAVALDPKHAKARMALAVSYASYLDLDSAKRNFEILKSLDPALAGELAKTALGQSILRIGKNKGDG